MSGGAMDYAYQRVNDVAEVVEIRARTPLQRAFAKHLVLVAKALHDLEWVWSGDYGEGDEERALRDVMCAKYVLNLEFDRLAKSMDECKELLEQFVWE